ncbi:unnamed protein product [Tenebrio molitor]|jgi:hypothetical protein|nr:unnamed protein product [Tenebrio molitor]
MMILMTMRNLEICKNKNNQYRIKTCLVLIHRDLPAVLQSALLRRYQEKL